VTQRAVLDALALGYRHVDTARIFGFEIPREDMRDLDSLHEDLHTSWDPTDAP
jgi:diketogulonate reductase-like aldo/keto reductase